MHSTVCSTKRLPLTPLLQLNKADSGLLIICCKGHFTDYLECLSFNYISNYEWTLKLFN
jgi:hypothetical protein